VSEQAAGEHAPGMQEEAEQALAVSRRSCGAGGTRLVAASGIATRRPAQIRVLNFESPARISESQTCA